MRMKMMLMKMGKMVMVNGRKKRKTKVIPVLSSEFDPRHS